jgi:hypothetical protein
LRRMQLNASVLKLLSGSLLLAGLLLRLAR